MCSVLAAAFFSAEYTLFLTLELPGEREGDASVDLMLP